MSDVPFPVTADDLESMRGQIYEIFRQLYEEKIGGADLGDVFGIIGDVLTLVLADTSGLTKEGNELSVEVTDTGGLQLGSSGILIKCKAAGGLTTDASGLYINITYQLASEKNSASGYAGLNASSRITKGVDTTDDIIVDLATKGLVLKDTQAIPHYWRVTITNLGVLTTADLGTVKP